MNCKRCDTECTTPYCPMCGSKVLNGGCAIEFRLHCWRNANNAKRRMNASKIILENLHKNEASTCNDVEIARRESRLDKWTRNYQKWISWCNFIDDAVIAGVKIGGN